MKKSYYNYVGVYTFSYGAMGTMLPLIGPYLDRIGFSGAEIGSVMATGTGVAIFASIFWGNLYNNSNHKKRVILGICLMASTVSVFLSGVGTYLTFVTVFGVLYFFQSPILALQDAMTLEDSHHFGPIRKWGAIGFAAGNLVASRVVSLAGLDTIFFMFSAGYILTGIMIWKIMRDTSGNEGLHTTKPAHSPPRQNMGKYRVLLSNKKFTLLIISAFFVSGTNVANNTYFGFLYLAGGGALAGIGIAFLLMVSSEALFMAWSDRLADRFTLEKTILISMLISVFRYLLFSMTPSSGLLLATFFLQGMVNGIVLVEFVRYIAKLVEPKLLGMAVSIYYCISCNVSTIVCLMAGGIILDAYGVGRVYLFFGLYNLAGVVLYAIWGLHKSENNGNKVTNKG